MFDIFVYSIVVIVHHANNLFYFSNISAKPHVAGSEQNFVVANYIRDLWTLNGLKNVRLVPYNVLLSHPNQENSNVVSTSLYL